MFTKSTAIAIAAAALVAATASAPAGAAEPTKPTRGDAPAVKTPSKAQRAALRREARRASGRGALRARSGTVCVSPEAPYKHVRITGQKMVYAHTYNRCGYGHIYTTLAKWNGSAWVEYRTNQTQVSYAHLFVNNFLCDRYGFGGSGSGHFANYSVHQVYSGGRLVTQARWSGVRYLSC